MFSSAQVNHYALRSMQSFLVKRARGRANHTSHVLGMDYWHRFNLNDETDTSIARYEVDTTALAQELNRDPVLRDLHQKAVTWHERKAKSMLIDPEMDPLVQELEKEISGSANSAIYRA